MTSKNDNNNNNNNMIRVNNNVKKELDKLNKEHNSFNRLFTKMIEDYTANKIIVNDDVKAELEKLKINNESFNNLFLRLIEENKKLNKILLNIEDLQNYIQEKEVKN